MLEPDRLVITQLNDLVRLKESRIRDLELEGGTQHRQRVRALEAELDLARREVVFMREQADDDRDRFGASLEAVQAGAESKAAEVASLRAQLLARDEEVEALKAKLQRSERNAKRGRGKPVRSQIAHLLIVNWSFRFEKCA